MSIAVILIANGSTVYWILSEAETYCPDCYKVTSIKIKAPLNGATISTSDNVFSDIIGEATPSQVCRYVYVFVRDMTSGEAYCVVPG